MEKESHNHSSERAIPIQIKNRTHQSPLPSPSEHSFGTSLPRSLERPKSIILTMDVIKSKNVRLTDPDFDAKSIANTDSDQVAAEDVSSSMYKPY